VALIASIIFFTLIALKRNDVLFAMIMNTSAFIIN
jgi:hypothetical protein